MFSSYGTICEKAFGDLKQLLLSAPILCYPNEKDDFILYTDASGCGLGAVLMQEQNGVEVADAVS